MKTWMIRGVVAVALFVGAMQGQAQAQVEALGFLGGVTDNGGFTFGGGLQVGLNERLLGVAEVGYLTVDGDNTSAVSVDLNVHYLFPTNDSKMTPYVLAGLGILKSSVSIGNFDVSDTDAGLNLGGGLRIEGGDNWGIRPEVKFLLRDNTSARLSVGVYYAF